MKNIIDFLRQQMILCMSLLEVLQRQTQALIAGDGKAVPQITHEIETLVAKLNMQEKTNQAFLQQQQVTTIQEWLAKQPAGTERQVAEQLLQKQYKLLQKLKDARSNNLQYLNNNMKFIDFNVNVMTQTAAGVTYGTPSDNGGRPVQGSKMFEANV